VREAGRREKGEERERASGDRAKKRGGGGRQAVSSCLAARLPPSLQLRRSPHEPTWSGSKLMGAQAHSTRFHVSSPLSAVVFRVGAGDPTAG
jgi:hypothetical protein